MRTIFSFLSLVVVLGIGYGVYYTYLKQAAPTPTSTAIQEISTTGVEMDLNAIAQAERMYYLQNGSYADLQQLTSAGTMNVNSSGRDGYSYSLDVAGGGFTVTARHDDVPASLVTGATAPLHYPTLSIDQNMQIQRNN